MSGKHSIGEQGWCYAGEEEGEEIQPIETLKVNVISNVCHVLLYHMYTSARESKAWNEKDPWIYLIWYMHFSHCNYNDESTTISPNSLGDEGAKDEVTQSWQTCHSKPSACSIVHRSRQIFQCWWWCWWWWCWWWCLWCWWQYWWASFVRGCECHRRQSINFWIIIIIILVFLFVLLFLIILQNVVSLLNCFSCTCSLVLLHGRKNDCGRLYYRAPLRSSGPLTSGKQGRTQKSIKSMESTKKQNLTSYTFRTMLPNFSVFS